LALLLNERHAFFDAEGFLSIFLEFLSVFPGHGQGHGQGHDLTPGNVELFGARSKAG
jgi:hypothetical protein